MEFLRDKAFPLFHFTWRWESWILFLILFLFRYVRLFVNVYAYYWGYRVVPVPVKPRYTSKDVTVIMPTITDDIDELQETLQSLADQDPAAIFISTIHSRKAKIQNLVNSLGARVPVYVKSIDKANKRHQMCHIHPFVWTDLTLHVDDDIKVEGGNFMALALAPFEDGSVGGVGTNQALIRRKNRGVWDYLGDMYLARRNFDCTATNHMDGSVPCLSGRAAMYRTSILKDEVFMDNFKNEDWRGLWKKKYRLNTDDDNFITRWLFSHNLKIVFQNHPDCKVVTTLATDRKRYIYQCLRWSRSNWRSNLTSMFVEKNVWRKFPWGTYAVFFTTLSHWSVAFDVALNLLAYKIVFYDNEYSPLTRNFLFWAVWFVGIWFTSKWIKFCGYYTQYPSEIPYIAVSMVFGWFHMFLKAYCLVTINTTEWGSREGADEDDPLRMITVNYDPSLYEKSGLLSSSRTDELRSPDITTCKRYSRLRRLPSIFRIPPRLSHGDIEVEEPCLV